MIDSKQHSVFQPEWQSEPNVHCVSCPDCGFTFDMAHIDQDGRYSCPTCAEIRLEEQLEAADRQPAYWIFHEWVLKNAPHIAELCPYKFPLWRDLANAYWNNEARQVARDKDSFPASEPEAL